MKVEILVGGIQYAEFLPSGRQVATKRAEGDVVEYPDWYALKLIDMDLAQKAGTDVSAETKPAKKSESSQQGDDDGKSDSADTADDADESTESDSDEPAADGEEDASESDDEINASRSAQALATEAGVDLSKVEGTGTDGAVGINDVRAYIKAREESDT